MHQTKLSLTLAKIASLKSDLAHLKLRLAIRAGYDPDQARWPQGTSEGGRWRAVGGVTKVAGKWNEDNLAMCWLQQSRDEALCRITQSPLCWDLSVRRFAACMKDDFIPTLRH